MNISFLEGLALATYLEFFNHQYDVADERKYKEGPELLVRHVEMQNLDFLLTVLLGKDTYSYSWNFRGPYSPGFQILLNRLDTKKEDIAKFYEEYNKKREMHYNTYEEQLKGLLSYYLNEHSIMKVLKAIQILEGIFRKEMGSEIFAGLTYIERYVLPHERFSDAVKVLRERGYNPSDEILRDVEVALSLLNIIEMEPKSISNTSIVKEEQRKRVLE